MWLIRSRTVHDAHGVVASSCSGATRARTDCVDANPRASNSAPMPSPSVPVRSPTPRR